MTLKVVKWIKKDEIEISVDFKDDLSLISELGLRVYKHPRNGRRRNGSFYYLRYTSSTVYSTGPYRFPDNPDLERVCLFLNDHGFVFWGCFKTEISPYDFMVNLQRKGKLRCSFNYVQAGGNKVLKQKCSE